MQNQLNLKNETISFEESKEVLESIFQEFTDDQDSFGLKSIMSALMLPEKEFALLSEHILNEIEKSLNDVEDKMIMVQSLNASGLKAEDLTKQYLTMMENIEKEFSNKISPQKIDFLKRFIGILVEAINSTEGIAKRIIPVAISYCHPDAKCPKYAHAGDAGLDLIAPETYCINPGETILIKTGLKIALPLGYEMQVRPRSGQSLKTKLRIANSPGTIDANYRDEIGVIIENIEPVITKLETDPVYINDKLDHLKIINVEYGRNFVIEKGQKFAQLVLSEKPYCMFYEVDDVKAIEGDRCGGFGSTGK